ncbi:MAG: hypothetical protein IJW13_04795 [Clostridia bacterium]|nr:hypothetical protein [Clostridia bacterium]
MNDKLLAMQVFQEDSNTFSYKKDGQLKMGTIHIGEDAHPYASSDILIVADGLGGRGGYPHTKIKKELIEGGKDNFISTMFNGVFEQELTAEVNEYIIDNFAEVFDTVEYYFENARTMRSSGYFASRIVTSIALYELRQNPAFAPKSLFEKLNGCLSEEEKQLVTQEYGDKLVQIIMAKLKKVAENCNFELEAKVTGAYLLPTTLQIALIDDLGESLQVVWLWAGDSRAYVWSQGEGLQQITEDHEHNETMTNLITLTKPECRLEAHYMQNIAKPCMLLNLSDGCYKCPIFASPIDLEYLILDGMRNNDSFANVSKGLVGTFNVISTGDDSGTMASYAYGYENYAEVKQCAMKRIEYINDFVSDLKDIFEVDYKYDFEQANALLSAEINSYINDKLILVDYKHRKENATQLDKRLYEYVNAQLFKYPPFVNLHSERKQVRKQLTDLISANWINEKNAEASLRNLAIGWKTKIEKENYYRIQKIEGGYKKDAINYEGESKAIFELGVKRIFELRFDFIDGEEKCAITFKNDDKWIKKALVSKELATSLVQLRDRMSELYKQIQTVIPVQYFKENALDIVGALIEGKVDGISEEQAQQMLGENLIALDIKRNELKQKLAVRQGIYDKYYAQYCKKIAKSRLGL